MADIKLSAPRSLDDLYLGRGDEVPLSRPVLTGDVFRGVELEIDQDDGLVMVVAHPCSMRADRGRLRPRVAVASVRLYSAVSFDRWQGGHYNVLPLPELVGDHDSSRAADFLNLSSAASVMLNRRQRVAALSNRGIHILQQRFVHSFTRVVVGLEKLEDQAAHVLLEAELEGEWVDELADENLASLDEASEEFANYLDGHELRVALLEPTRRSDVARAIRMEIRRRADAAGKSEG